MSIGPSLITFWPGYEFLWTFFLFATSTRDTLSDTFRTYFAHLDCSRYFDCTAAILMHNGKAYLCRYLKWHNSWTPPTPTPTAIIHHFKWLLGSDMRLVPNNYWAHLAEQGTPKMSGMSDLHVWWRWLAWQPRQSLPLVPSETISR